MDTPKRNRRPPIRQRSSISSSSASNHARTVFGNEDFDPNSPPQYFIRKPSARKYSTRTASTVTWATKDSSFPSIISQQGSVGSNNHGGLPRRKAKEFLTVIHAAPLVYQDELSKEIKPIGILDFTMERMALKKALEGTELDVMFDFATTDRLSKFLIEDRGRVLHYSGHGHAEYLTNDDRWGKQYLAIEDGRGKMHKLTVEDLEDWIKQGGNNLELVFVSACHSRAVGEAFVNAGVKHVVCCGHDEHEIRNDAAVEFTKAFYQALANGRTVSQAFKDGESKVKTSSYMDRSVAQQEVAKFVLLPENSDHDVKIYDPENPPIGPERLYTEEEMQLMVEKDRGTLPRPPDNFEGRQVEMYQLLSKLMKTRIVRITGSEGIGKRSVVKAVCHYILDRQHIFKNYIDHLVWLPVDSETGEVDCRALLDGGNADDRERLVGELNANKFLLMVDARCCSQLELVEELLRDIIDHTSTRAIVIERFDSPGRLQLLPGLAEAEVHIAPLDFQNTVWLFGSHCPLVSEGKDSDVKCAKDFRSAIIPQDAKLGDLDTKSGRAFYNTLGGGIPKDIQRIAKNTKDDDAYRKILQQGRKHKLILEWMQDLRVHSRAQLDSMIMGMTKKKQSARDKRKFEEADTWSKKLGELGELQIKFPNLKSLEQEYRKLEEGIRLAFRQEDYVKTKALSTDQYIVKRKIRTEKMAVTNPTGLEYAMSHRKLTEKVKSLEFEWAQALGTDEDDLDKAEYVKKELIRYRSLLKTKSSLESLQQITAQRLEAYTSAKAYAANNDESLCDVSKLRELKEYLLEAYDRENAEVLAQSYDDVPADVADQVSVSESSETVTQTTGYESDSQESQSDLIKSQREEHMSRTPPKAVTTGFGSRVHSLGYTPSIGSGLIKYGCPKPAPAAHLGRGAPGETKQLKDVDQRRPKVTSSEFDTNTHSDSYSNSREADVDDHSSRSSDSSVESSDRNEKKMASKARAAGCKTHLGPEDPGKSKYPNVFQPGQESPGEPRPIKNEIQWEPRTEIIMMPKSNLDESFGAMMLTDEAETSSLRSESSSSVPSTRLLLRSSSTPENIYTSPSASSADQVDLENEEQYVSNVGMMDSECKPAGCKTHLGPDDLDRSKYSIVFQPGEESPGEPRPIKNEIQWEPRAETTLIPTSKFGESLGALMPADEVETSSQRSESSASVPSTRLLIGSSSSAESFEINTRPSNSSAAQDEEQSIVNPQGPSGGDMEQFARAPTHSSSLPARLGMQKASNKVPDFPSVPQTNNPSRPPEKTLMNLPFDAFNHSYRLNRNPDKIRGLAMSEDVDAPSRTELGLVSPARRPDVEDGREENRPSFPLRRKYPPGTHSQDQMGTSFQEASATFQEASVDRTSAPTPSTTFAGALCGNRPSSDLIAENDEDDSEDDSEKKPTAKSDTTLYHVRVPDQVNHNILWNLEAQLPTKEDSKMVRSLEATLALESEAGEPKEKKSHIVEGEPAAPVPGAHRVAGINHTSSSLMDDSSTRDITVVPVATVLDSEARNAEIDDYLQGIVVAEAVAVSGETSIEQDERRGRFKKAAKKLMCVFRRKKKRERNDKGK